mgnify:CR=1 FL=1
MSMIISLLLEQSSLGDLMMDNRFDNGKYQILERCEDYIIVILDNNSLYVNFSNRLLDEDIIKLFNYIILKF